MNKTIVARYSCVETAYKIPIEWDVDDISIYYGKTYYQGKEVFLKSIHWEVDMKTPETIDETEDYDVYFDCEEDPTS